MSALSKDVRLIPILESCLSLTIRFIFIPEAFTFKALIDHVVNGGYTASIGCCARIGSFIMGIVRFDSGLDISISSQDSITSLDIFVS